MVSSNFGTLMAKKSNGKKSVPTNKIHKMGSKKKPTKKKGY
jgi:hypothetical protein